MAHVIEVKGKAAVVFGLKDLMELIDQHMGMEFRGLPLRRRLQRHTRRSMNGQRSYGSTTVSWMRSVSITTT